MTTPMYKIIKKMEQTLSYKKLVDLLHLKDYKPRSNTIPSKYLLELFYQPEQEMKLRKELLATYLENSKIQKNLLKPI